MLPLKNSCLNVKNLHLAISVILVVPVALVYGVHPYVMLWKLFDFKVATINLTGIFRAMMGLYLAMSSLWIIGILKIKYWTTATISNIVFMGGLASGRLLSVVIDGVPKVYFLIGFILELVLAIWGLKNLKKYKY